MEDDDDSSDAEPLRVEVTNRRGEATVIVVGYLDANTARLFRESGDVVLAARPQSIASDAGGVTFVDSSGLGALLSARHSVTTEAGLAFRIVDPSPALRRTADLAGFNELLGED